jgi:leucyl aminopeptidase
MRLEVVRSNELALVQEETCLVVPLLENDLPLNSDVLTEADELTLQALADKGIVRGKAEEVTYLPTPGGAYKGVLVAGLGRAEKAGVEAPRPGAREALRRTAGKACATLGQQRVGHVYFDISRHSHLPAEAFVEGILLGQYDFDIYKARPEGEEGPVRVEVITIVIAADADPAPVQAACDLAAVLCLAANGARHLANTPPNDMTPEALAQFARGIAGESPHMTCEVLEEAQMASLGMNALLAVAQGGGQAPKLIILRYHHDDSAKTLAVVGKGVTFDTGGISIKPAAAMHEMKFDMCGAAAVLGAMMAVDQLKPAVNVVALVPAVENKPDGNAMVPGDILRAYNGKTIEVLNTDAEGRLILADALAFAAEKFHPNAMLDFATLTGAALVALGHHAAPVMTTSDDVYHALAKAAEAAGERIWRFPLWDDYREMIKGTHADIANIGPERLAGTIMGAVFLEHFVKDVPWAHVDIAGTAWGGKGISYLDPKHATGYGVRLLVHWILESAK